MAASKINVAVVMGGISTEHDVSLNSGGNVCNSLDQEKFNVKPIVIEKGGNWLIFNGWLTDSDRFEAMPPGLKAVRPADAAAMLIDAGVDVVFIALHGPGGEDGVIQGFFDTVGLAYTGSGVVGNALGMEKVLAKKIFIQEGLHTPRFLVEKSVAIAGEIEALVSRVSKELGFPCVPKISNQGSSHNVGIAANEVELEKMLSEFSQAGDEILVEEYIRGREVTCAVIDRPGSRESTALPPTELVPVSSAFFDYHAKYTPGATEEITPARISDEETKEIQRIAVRCHNALMCGGMSRTDTILKDGIFYVLEINTIPGLTATSLIPQAAAAVGIGFPELLEIQVRWALEKRSRSPR